MNLATFIDFIQRFGYLTIFVVVFIEYLNMPGFPAGVIMPAAGLMAARGNLNIILVVLLSVAAGLLGSWALYLIGRLGGDAFRSWMSRKFPKKSAKLEEVLGKLQRKGLIVVFTAKLLPAIRTIISIPAGIIRLNFKKYTLCSAIGILIWNGVLIGAGYFFGQLFFDTDTYELIVCIFYSTIS